MIDSLLRYVMPVGREWAGYLCLTLGSEEIARQSATSHAFCRRYVIFFDGAALHFVADTVRNNVIPK